MEKYYVPQIEEFHIGFEFEFLEKGGPLLREEDRYEKWVSEIADSDWLEIVSTDWEDAPEEYHNRVRVKYLNREDIESFGFILNAQDWYDELTVNIKPDVYGYKIWKLRCQHRPDTKWFKLEALFEDDAWYTLFEGMVKNKSELRKLLNSIGLCQK